MKPSLLIYSLFIILLTSCADKKQSLTIETIIATPSVTQQQFFSDFVESIEVIPLETKEDLFIRNNRVMEVYKGDIYISNVDNGLRDDSRGESNIILRFDKDGKFINKIGHFSRSGANTYFFYSNYYLDSIAYIFSFPNFCVNKYTLSGEFISKDTLVSLSEFNQAAFFNNEYIVNIDSYTKMGDYLLMFCNGQGEILSKQISIKTKLRYSYNRHHNFTKYKNTLLYREKIKDTIYQISNKGVVSPKVFVDYGEERRSHKENYIRTKTNSLENFYEYIKKPSANNNLYYESDEYCLLETYECESTTKHYNPISRLALKNKKLGNMTFVDFINENKTFNETVEFLDGKKLYFLVQARYITPMEEWLKPYFVNLSALDNIKPQDNDVVFIFNLK